MKSNIIFNKSRTYFLLLGFTAAIGLLFIFSTFNFVKNDSSVDEQFPQGYKIISPEIPKNLEFAGEEVPLNDFEVYERIDREFLVNTYFHSSTILSMKRANRWFPVIEPILKKYNVPDDFKYLAVIESGLDNVVSPVGATGFWQLTKDTAKKYGLDVNDEVDERYNVEKSTEAACKYLLEAYNEFNNWTVAAASYNFGVNGIAKQIERQKSSDYYNLVLGDETSRYIPRAIAIKEILNNPEKYGFDIKQSALYAPLSFDLIELKTPVEDFADFAEKNNINYKILKTYNPWLRDSFLTNKNNKTYVLKIPASGELKTTKE